ncbi:MAG: DMT family transporter [Paracoccaceae bacterium]
MSLAQDPLRPPPSPARLALSGNLMCMASMLAWAAGFPAAETLLTRWEPLPLITARFLLSILMLLPLWVVLDGPRAVLRANWPRGVAVGGLGFGLGAWLLLVAQSLTDPVTVAIIASATPVAGTVLEMLQDGRRLGAGFVLGLVASVVGGAIAVSGPAGGGALALGAATAVLACFLFVWGSRASVKGFPELSNTGRTTITLAGGLVATGAIFLAAWALGLSALPEGGWQPGEAGQLAVYALASMAISQLLWIAAVGRLGVALAAFHVNVAPFYVMVLMLAMGGGWSWRQALGAAIVALGVIVAQAPPRRARLAD